MSKKQWFILRVDHHLGPFSHEELIDLYKRAKLREVDQLWREGMSGWKQFKQLEEFADLWAPPPLPNIPKAEVKLQENGLPPLPLSDEVPPPLPPLPEEEPSVYAEDIFEPQPGPNKESKTETEVYTEIQESKQSLEEIIEDKSKSTGPSKIKWFTAALVCLLALSTGLMIFFNRPSQEVDFFEVRVQKAQAMKSFLRQNRDVFNAENMPFSLALSRDSQSLVLASAYTGTAKIFLQLESIEGKGLFSSPVVITAKAQLLHHKAVFKDLTWEQGRSLVPGFYSYRISAIPTGIEAQIRGALQRSGFAEEAPKPFKGEGEVLLTRWEKEEFDQKLKQFRIKLTSQEMVPLEERLQRYQTLEGLASQVLGLYKEVLPIVRRPKDMRLFEQRYASEVAGLLQELIIEAHKKAIKYKKVDPEKAKGFEFLREFGKDVGGLVSDMVTTTQQTPGLNNVKKSRLKKLFENRVQALTQEAQKRQRSIRSQMEDLVSID